MGEMEYVMQKDTTTAGVCVGVGGGGKMERKRST
jgi:hypothetical protein